MPDDGSNVGKVSLRLMTYGRVSLFSRSILNVFWILNKVYCIDDLMEEKGIGGIACYITIDNDIDAICDAIDDAKEFFGEGFHNDVNKFDKFKILLNHNPTSKEWLFIFGKLNSLEESGNGRGIEEGKTIVYSIDLMIHALDAVIDFPDNFMKEENHFEEIWNILKKDRNI